jgi:succinyl-CoA synthetase beta subunit
LQGTNAELAKELIDNSGLAVHSAVQFQEAADKVKELLAQ